MTLLESVRAADAKEVGVGNPAEERSAARTGKVCLWRFRKVNLSVRDAAVLSLALDRAVNRLKRELQPPFDLNSRGSGSRLQAVRQEDATPLALEGRAALSERAANRVSTDNPETCRDDVGLEK